MPLAFFIYAGTEPIEPGPGAYRTGTEIILYDAPSREAAEKWAQAYVRENLLVPRPDHKLAYLNLLPFQDEILTPTGEKKIEWPSFAEHVNAMREQGGYSPELHSSMGMTLSKDRSPRETERLDLESLKQLVSDFDQYNWDPQKPSYYVLYYDRRAVMVEEVNLFVAMVRHGHAIVNPEDHPKNILITAWPGALKYNE
ncbi:MAG: hypothetical protein QM796_20770 [Chthoniobacteraceae bacterium]